MSSIEAIVADLIRGNFGQFFPELSRENFIHVKLGIQQRDEGGASSFGDVNEVQQVVLAQHTGL